MRARWLFSLLALVLGSFGGVVLRAEEKKSPTPPEPPKPLVTIPLGVIAGRTNLVVVRGLRVKDATNVVLDGWSRPLPVLVRKREDAKPPDGVTAARAGDQQLEVEVLVPAEAVGATNLVWKVSGTNGVGTLTGIPVFSAEEWIEARKPNGGFAEAQVLKFGQIVRGTLEKAGDVDVFRIEVTPGAKLHAEIRASRIGSTLDAILTLYDQQGSLLASNDDAFDQDPAVDHTVSAAGPLFVVVTYANEKASKTHGYLLRVEAVK